MWLWVLKKDIIMQNATMLYKLGGVHKHYEPKIGYIDYDYIIVDESEVQNYLSQGWGLNPTEMYLDSKKPKEVIIQTPLEIETPKHENRFKGKKSDVSEDNL
jgi:hypothetical protein